MLGLAQNAPADLVMDNLQALNKLDFIRLLLHLLQQRIVVQVLKVKVLIEVFLVVALIVSLVAACRIDATEVIGAWLMMMLVRCSQLYAFEGVRKCVIERRKTKSSIKGGIAVNAMNAGWKWILVVPNRQNLFARWGNVASLFRNGLVDGVVAADGRRAWSQSHSLIRSTLLTLIDMQKSVLILFLAILSAHRPERSSLVAAVLRSALGVAVTLLQCSSLA